MTLTVQRSVIITRTQSGTRRSIEGVKALGALPVASPVAQVVRRAPALGADGVDAIAFTSANAVTSLRDVAPLAHVPVFAVGAGTALAAKKAGFLQVSESAGDAEALARHIAARVSKASRIVHLAGEERAGDLAGMLDVLGFRAQTIIVYRTRLARGLTRGAREALVAPGTLVLIHSARGAERFLQLVRSEGEANRLTTLGFVCLSERAAVPLHAAGLDARVAPEPTEESLMATLEIALAGQGR